MVLTNFLNLFAFGEGDSGATTADAGQTAETQVASARDMDAEFEGLIKGDYKEQFDKRVGSIVQKRLKSTKDIVDRYNKAQPVFETLAKKYHVTDASDIESIAKAMDEDSAYIEEEAIERGVSVEQMREIRKMERENKALKAEMEARDIEEKAKKQYAQWFEQAEETKKYFPSFSIEKELQSDEFRRLLNAGVDVKTAFQVLHQDEIIPTMMQFTAQKTAQKTAAAVRANGLRPSENGSSSQAATTSKIDVSSLTKEQREALFMRAMAGERITFS